MQPADARSAIAENWPESSDLPPAASSNQTDAVMMARPEAGLVPAAPPALAASTRATAAGMRAAIEAAYLDFRREYYHESAPTLETDPPVYAEIRQAELARLAESILRVVPPGIKSVAIVGGFIEHLQNVANLHSISERERAALHQLARVVLDGLSDGIQPWFVVWRIAAARRLTTVPDGQYYLTFPWESLLYLPPAELDAFETRARAGDVRVIEREMRRLSDHLIRVLRDPIRVQPDLVFVGPDADRQRLRFHLKTLVALGLLTYVVVAEARRLFNPPRPPRPVPSSVLPPVPPREAARA